MKKILSFILLVISLNGIADACTGTGAKFCTASAGAACAGSGNGTVGFFNLACLAEAQGGDCSAATTPGAAACAVERPSTGPATNTCTGNGTFKTVASTSPAIPSLSVTLDKACVKTNHTSCAATTAIPLTSPCLASAESCTGSKSYRIGSSTKTLSEACFKTTHGYGKTCTQGDMVIASSDCDTSNVSRGPGASGFVTDFSPSDSKSQNTNVFSPSVDFYKKLFLCPTKTLILYDEVKKTYTACNSGSDIVADGTHTFICDVSIHGTYSSSISEVLAKLGKVIPSGQNGSLDPGVVVKNLSPLKPISAKGIDAIWQDPISMKFPADDSVKIIPAGKNMTKIALHGLSKANFPYGATLTYKNTLPGANKTSKQFILDKNILSTNTPLDNFHCVSNVGSTDMMVSIHLKDATSAPQVERYSPTDCVLQSTDDGDGSLIGISIKEYSTWTGEAAKGGYFVLKARTAESVGTTLNKTIDTYVSEKKDTNIDVDSGFVSRLISGTVPYTISSKTDILAPNHVFSTPIPSKPTSSTLNNLTFTAKVKEDQNNKFPKEIIIGTMLSTEGNPIIPHLNNPNCIVRGYTPTMSVSLHTSVDTEPIRKDVCVIRDWESKSTSLYVRKYISPLTPSTDNKTAAFPVVLTFDKSDQVAMFSETDFTFGIKEDSVESESGLPWSPQMVDNSPLGIREYNLDVNSALPTPQTPVVVGGNISTNTVKFRLFAPVNRRGINIKVVDSSTYPAKFVLELERVTPQGTTFVPLPMVNNAGALYFNRPNVANNIPSGGVSVNSGANYFVRVRATQTEAIGKIQLVVTPIK
jgi:hypothetical protein